MLGKEWLIKKISGIAIHVKIHLIRMHKSKCQFFKLKVYDRKDLFTMHILFIFFQKALTEMYINFSCYII